MDATPWPLAESSSRDFRRNVVPASAFRGWPLVAEFNAFSIRVTLRACGCGGSVERLSYLVCDLFGKDVKIADRIGRKENKPR